MSTIKVDTIATRSGSGSVTVSNNIALATEGQIDINSTNLLVRSTGNKSGLRFDTNSLTPFKNGSQTDNAVDLGFANARFKDLYLSGGLYVGGTDQAHKFDDYEEGTFTPAITGLTLSTALGHYTKIGNVVHWGVQLGIPSTSASTHFKINNPPFANATNQFGGAVIYANHNVVDNPTVIVVSGEIQFYKNGSSFVTYADYSGKDVRASGAYLTS